MEDDFDLPEPCPLCGGDLCPLGTLGTLQWFRCRHCGINVSSPKAPELESANVDLLA